MCGIKLSGQVLAFNEEQGPRGGLIHLGELHTGTQGAPASTAAAGSLCWTRGPSPKRRAHTPFVAVVHAVANPPARGPAAAASRPSCPTRAGLPGPAPPLGLRVGRDWNPRDAALSSCGQEKPRRRAGRALQIPAALPGAAPRRRGRPCPQVPGSASAPPPGSALLPPTLPPAASPAPRAPKPSSASWWQPLAPSARAASKEPDPLPAARARRAPARPPLRERGETRSRQPRGRKLSPLRGTHRAGERRKPPRRRTRYDDVSTTATPAKRRGERQL